MKIFILFILFLLAFPTFGQLQTDSTSVEEVFESVIEDTTYLYSDQSDSAYANVQYTQTPRELSVTQDERLKEYTSKKFSKTEWRRIVGNTKYTEEAEKQVRKMPTLAWDPYMLKVIAYVIIFGLITFLIVLFIKQALKDSDVKIRKKEAALFSDQTAPEALEEMNLEKLLQEALAQKNLRLAVRLYYIKLLKHLNQEGYIRWEKNKTNRDYAEELAVFGFSRDFRKLMNAYEYVWYGDRTPSADEFSAIESNFKTLYKAQRA
jgi:hypothetical protein